MRTAKIEFLALADAFLDAGFAPEIESEVREMFRDQLVDFTPGVRVGLAEMKKSLAAFLDSETDGQKLHSNAMAETAFAQSIAETVNEVGLNGTEVVELRERNIELGDEINALNQAKLDQAQQMMDMAQQMKEMQEAQG